jgi:hypothetical protein
MAISNGGHTPLNTVDRRNARLKNTDPAMKTHAPWTSASPMP